MNSLFSFVLKLFAIVFLMSGSLSSASVISCEDQINDASVVIDLSTKSTKSRRSSRTVKIDVKINSENYQKIFTDKTSEFFFDYGYYSFYNDEYFFINQNHEMSSSIEAGVYRVNYNSVDQKAEIVFRRDATSDKKLFNNLDCK